MSDLFQGQTMTAAYKFIVPNPVAAYTFPFDFYPDKVVFNNLTKWTATAGGDPISVWFKGQTTNGRAFQETVIDSAAAQSFNFKNAASNGFTVASTEGGVDSSQATISGITAADPVVITHSAYTFQTDQIVRITDLGQVTPSVNRGMGQLNNNRYKIVVLTPTTFSLKDVITGEPIDGTTFTAYVSGGRICLETHVISLNNPQVFPYAVTPYVPNPYAYKPVVFQLTVGTDVLQTAGDEFLIEVYKWGQVIDLGTL